MPAGFQILPLEFQHGPIIYSHWKYIFPGAKEYLTNLIKISDGFGIFEMSSGNLCSWIIINEYGVFGVLHTVEEYRGRKLATEIVKYMAIHRAKLGLDSISNVEVENLVSQKIFSSLGFVWVHNIKWVQFRKD